MPRNPQNLTNQERQAVYDALLELSEAGKIKKGSFETVALQFKVSQRTIRRIWHEAKRQVEEGKLVDVSSKFTKVIRRKRVEINPEAVLEIPLNQRSNIRSFAKALGVCKSTLHRRVKAGDLIPHTNPIKPQLTPQNRKQRLEFCLNSIDRTVEGKPVFNPMFNRIHVDEKWFYISKCSKRYYLLPGEAEPVRTCKSKKYITKVMFLAAVARPRFRQSTGEELFSGKIGIFPFTVRTPAQRSSRNRAAGTLQTQPISVTKDVTRQFMIRKVIPAILQQWPADDAAPIWIQWDNAKPHIPCHDLEFLEAVAASGRDIRLTFQPPNSPDFNVLDLGFFRAIQSLQEQEAPSNIDELVKAVETSFQSMPATDLNKVFLTLQCCMKEAMRNGGSNTYRLPHIAKGRLEKEGRLPLQIEVDQALVDAVEREALG